VSRQLRLLELYDVVDLFVLYETPYTQTGVEKPLYFNNSLAGTSRRSAVLLAAPSTGRAVCLHACVGGVRVCVCCAGRM
jgi:hypothetical protein